MTYTGENTIARAHARRFKLGIGLVELESNPLYTVIYNRPGQQQSAEENKFDREVVDKVHLLTLDDIISDSLKLL